MKVRGLGIFAGFRVWGRFFLLGRGEGGVLYVEVKFRGLGAIGCSGFEKLLPCGLGGRFLVCKPAGMFKHPLI